MSELSDKEIIKIDKIYIMHLEKMIVSLLGGKTVDDVVEYTGLDREYCKQMLLMKDNILLFKNK